MSEKFKQIFYTRTSASIPGSHFVQASKMEEFILRPSKKIRPQETFAIDFQEKSIFIPALPSFLTLGYYTGIVPFRLIYNNAKTCWELTRSTTQIVNFFEIFLKFLTNC